MNSSTPKTERSASTQLRKAVFGGSQIPISSVVAAVAVACCLMSQTMAGSRCVEDKTNPSLASEINSKIDPRDAPWKHWGWQKHGVVRLNGSARRLTGC